MRRRGVRDVEIRGALGEVAFEAVWRFWSVDERGEWFACGDER